MTWKEQRHSVADFMDWDRIRAAYRGEDGELDHEGFVKALEEEKSKARAKVAELEERDRVHREFCRKNANRKPLSDGDVWVSRTGYHGRRWAY